MGTCVGCGAPLAPTWKYCIHCGIAVDAQEIPAAIRPPEATPPQNRAVNRVLLVGGIGTFLIGLALIVVAVAYAIGALK